MGQLQSTIPYGGLQELQSTAGESSGASADPLQAPTDIYHPPVPPPALLPDAFAAYANSRGSGNRYELVSAGSHPLTEGPSDVVEMRLHPHMLSPLTTHILRSILSHFNIRPGSRAKKADLVSALTHIMTVQPVFVRIRPTMSHFNFSVGEQRGVAVRGEAQEESMDDNQLGQSATAPVEFPPPPVSREETERVINKVCDFFSDESIYESGCAVCGKLAKTSEQSPLDELRPQDISLLTLNLGDSEECTRRERASAEDRVEGIAGPVLDPGCSGYCEECKADLLRGKTPTFSLANGRWLGAIPSELKDLTFFEERLIARVHRSIYIAKARESNRHKLVGNVVSYPAPTPRIYNVLPPAKADAEHMLAYMFMGPRAPTNTTAHKMPLFVRRNRVRRALDWLKLNHCDYSDIEISEAHLGQYSDTTQGEIPVKIIYHYEERDHTRDQESTAVYDHDPEGNTSGTDDCLYSVTALIPDADGNDPDEPGRLAQAVQNLRDGQAVLGIGRGAVPLRFFDDPQYLPSTYPTLFPYGMGGIHNRRGVNAKKNISPDVWIRRLLMHWDKRFQRHEDFILSVFSNQQFRQSSRSTYIQTKKRQFQEVAELLTRLRVEAVSEVIADYEHGRKPDSTKPEVSDVLKALQKVELVTQPVYGSVSSRRKMKKELWSLISQKGAPTWFLTISPPEHKSAVCLYFADTRDTILVGERLPADIRNIIARNPAAGARYFNFVVSLLLSYVIGEDLEDGRGLFGIVDTYYGTVEQQARLTLHLHLLIWIKGSFTPNEIRDKLKAKDAVFTKALIDYLKSCHRGDFQPVPAGSEEFVTEDDIKRYLQSTPSPVPVQCEEQCGSCPSCEENTRWWDCNAERTNESVRNLNMHRHQWFSCRKSEFTECKARFPRDVVEVDHVDDSGHVFLEKHEPMLNSFNDALTYLFRCNTDVTSILSGTAVNSVTAYITDYVSKSTLRTSTMFEAIRQVLQRDIDEEDVEDLEQEDQARRLLTRMVNKLTSYQEIGSPMAAMYLLGHPDHYTNIDFVPFYWKQYVNHIYKTPADHNTLSTYQVEAEEDDETGEIVNDEGSYVFYQAVQDYIFRPRQLEAMSLLDFHLEFVKKPKKRVPVDRALGGGGTNGPATDNQRVFYVNMNPSRGRPEQVDNLFFLPGHSKQNKLCLQKRKLASKSQLAADFITPLPRKDGADPEFYAATMLCLTVPWRTTGDLRNDGENWVSALDRSLPNIEGRGAQLIRCNNVRHECLDARDDFASHRDQVQTLPAHVSDLDVENDAALVSFDEFFAQRDKASGRDLQEQLVFEGYLRRIGLYDELPVGHMSMPPAAELLPIRTTAAYSKAIDEAARIAVEGRQNHGGRTTPQPLPHPVPDGIRMLHYTTESIDEREVARRCAAEANLNDEQRRAYDIVVDQAIDPKDEPLRMLIHGQGGTGKSQILKAILAFFTELDRLDEIAVLAPTGTAAALINGQTYHAFLAMARGEDGDTIRSSPARRREAEKRIKKIKFIFIDEISMVGCYELYLISKFLAEARTEASHHPFGGINMIFAGDFAQLPPVSSTPLTAPPSAFRANSDRTQKSLIGRLIWNQTTAVVSLTKNMRQRQDGILEHNYRRLLANLRFCAIDDDDVNTMYDLLVDSGMGGKNLRAHMNRTTAVITSTNIIKDCINATCSDLYAKETDQQLQSFYSIDVGSYRSGPSNKKKGMGRTTSRRMLGPTISVREQSRLDDLSPAYTDKIPGRLRLAKGIPIIIKKNVATVLGITNGAEATVEGWLVDESNSRPNRAVLKAIFARLSAPVRPVQIPGFPPNVVPLVRASTSISARHLSGVKRSLKRHQIPVDLNFAMTDYASQGKTKDINVVDLQGMKDHHGMYTALSRGRSASGTVILTMPNNIQKLKTGLSHSPALRTFQEIELMNHITLLRYQNQLHPRCKGHTWQMLLRTYVEACGIPNLDLHPAIAFSTSTWQRWPDWETHEERAELFNTNQEAAGKRRAESQLQRIQSKRRRVGST